MTRLLAAAAGAALPAAALACPSCARDGTPWAAVLVAGMIAAPYAVAVVVIRAVRAADRGGKP
jgi:hypothetical protein